MKITSLEVNGFQRFVLTQIQALRAEFTQPLQVIIGTNGSGKSSILELLTGDAALSDYFIKGGQGRLKKTIVHQGHEYVMEATFDGGQRHFFSKDGVVLNDWGTLLVQKDLVKQEFGLTPSVVCLLQGKEKFTSMGPLRRKEWFIQLCEANYDYAMRVYTRCKELLRDTEGALKNTKKRLAAEQAGILKPEEEKALTLEVENLHQLVESLQEIRIPLERDPGDVIDDVYQNTKQLNDVADKLKALQAKVKQTGYWTESQADAVLERFKSDYRVCTALLQAAAKEHTDNADKIALLQQAEAKTISTLQEEQKELIAQIATLMDTLLVPALPQPEQAQQVWQTLTGTLIDVFTNIKPNPNKKYSSQAQQMASQRRASLQSQLTACSEESVKLKVQIEHLERHKDNPDLTCPKCDHQFSAKYNPADYAVLKDRLRLLQETTAQHQEKLKEVEAYLVDCAEYAQYYRQYSNAVISAPVLDPYWKECFSVARLYDEPNSLVTVVNQVAADLKTQTYVNELRIQLTQKTELIQKLSRLDTADLQLLQDRQKLLQDTIEKHTSRLSVNISRGKYYAGIKQQAKSVAQLLEASNTLCEKATHLKTQYFEATRRVAFNAFLREAQSLLARKVSALRENEKTQAVISDLTRNIVSLEAEIDAYSAMVASLCPNKGLIAKGLYGFLENFISDMNATIAAVWTYELRLGLPDAENGVELNYKFPVTIKGEKGPKDAKECSEGQCDIINFAFMFVARNYLGMQDYPLILDELGRTFDAAHKDNLVAFLKQVLEMSTHQIFMVSHDFRAYSSMPAEYMVLSTDNVLLPHSYNKHVTLN